MITFEHTEIFNIEGAIRGMRNSWESYEKSDSYQQLAFPDDAQEGELIQNVYKRMNKKFVIGPNDLKLATTLSKAGSGHDKFLRQILVSVDIIAPEYWWKEFDTYKVGTVANSTSMMHTAGKREFTVDDFSFEDEFIDGPYVQMYMNVINDVRDKWIRSGKKKPSPEWRLLIQLMANSFLYKRTVTMNYGVLKTAYHQRESHRLAEWHQFNEWVGSLPYSDLITLKEGVKHE